MIEPREFDLCEDKLACLLFTQGEFEIIVRKGREYVKRINPKYKEKEISQIDGCVLRLVLEKCRERYCFDTTGELNTEYDLLADVKRFVMTGRFLCMV